MSESSRSATMVEVGDKPVTERTARAEAFVTTRPEVVERVRAGQVEKGDALRVAEVAGLMALKRTAELLPMCHPLPFSGARITATIEGPDQLRVESFARTRDRTGVEMEVLTAASVAALCLYDLLKMYDPAMTIGPVRLLEHVGVTSGRWSAVQPNV